MKKSPALFSVGLQFCEHLTLLIHVLSGFVVRFFSPASSPQRQWELVLAQEMQKRAADVGWRVGMLLSMVATYVFKAFEKATA